MNEITPVAIHVERRFWSDSYAIFGKARGEDNRSYLIVSALNFEPISEVASSQDPIRPCLVNLDHGTAQSLLNQLYNCGLRPTDVPALDGEVAALRDNLKDLRAAVEHWRSLYMKLFDIWGQPHHMISLDDLKRRR